MAEQVSKLNYVCHGATAEGKEPDLNVKSEVLKFSGVRHRMTEEEKEPDLIALRRAMLDQLEFVWRHKGEVAPRRRRNFGRDWLCHAPHRERKAPPKEASHVQPKDYEESRLDCEVWRRVGTQVRQTADVSWRIAKEGEEVPGLDDVRGSDGAKRTAGCIRDNKRAGEVSGANGECTGSVGDRRVADC